MYEAAAKARDGDLAYFRALSEVELTSLVVGRDEDGRTLLHTAAARGDLDLMVLLLGAGSAKVASKHDDEVGG
jgi:ankyrin repeat protein